MNVPELDLGTVLSKFKADTRRLKPAYRGQRLGSDMFIRGIHNSFLRYGRELIITGEGLIIFIRRMDILNADLALLNDVEKAAKAKKATRRKSAKGKTKKDEEGLGYHFIAYVPVNGEVWRLDGLQRQPVNLGKCFIPY